ncbi:AAA domain-containing protein [Cerasicoccus frondis]|uniref:AAA domain-containing protein n=1 Tax=Cerasicoccus frondis TaxID=490090 RepID=UPI002852B65C|nr:AAA domain-containing protein [Cerasicoccus frondis]
MILNAMLQRLYASLQRGPCLNARPHNSRQRVDVTQLKQLQGISVDTILPTLLGGARKVSMPAQVSAFRKPEYPESEWSDEQKRHAKDYEQQTRLLKKLHDIANDAQEYFNDHGESALFVGFPIVSLPPKSGDDTFRSSRVLAPLAFVPVNLAVRKGANAGATLTVVGEGADLLIPNPALLAWIEKETGHEVPDLFDDETGDVPEKEFAEILEFARRALALDGADFEFATALQSIPKVDGLPEKSALVPAAILGLFPLANPGLMRDTKWMMANEAMLSGPITRYLRQDILVQTPEVNDAATPPPLPEQHAGEQGKAFDQEFFIAPIDPSQAATADAARTAKALVIHGPPGTGKSQTITNIIGDHLARGQRVLFVCDKRTALDVVMHRLNHYGLGHLCGIIHDPSRDRRNLYMGLRERMEALVDNAPLTNPERQLRKTNQRLTELNAELARYFELLHHYDEEQEHSFHGLVGEWFAYSRRAAGDIPAEMGGDVSLEAVETHVTDVGEVMLRAVEAHLSSNPFFEHTVLTLEGYFQLGHGAILEKITPLKQLADRVDHQHQDELPTLDEQSALLDQASLRESIHAALNAIVVDGDVALAATLGGLSAGVIQATADEWQTLQALVECVHDDLNREWVLLLSNSIPSLGDAMQRLAVLEEYAETKGSFFRFLQFKKKSAADEVLKQLGASMSDDHVDEAIAFYQGVRARWRLVDLYGRITESTLSANDDKSLRRALTTLEQTFAIFKACGGYENSGLWARISEGLHDAEATSKMAELFIVSARRARELDVFIESMNGVALFKDAYIQATDCAMRRNESAGPIVENWAEHVDLLEEVVRLEDALGRMPNSLKPVLRELALRELDTEQATIELKQLAFQNEVRRYVERDPELLRIDSARINAAFDEYGRRMAEKQDLVRQFIVYSWDKRQRQQLLASTGSRLNSNGAALRNRLYVRGKKALKLRQMIATGEGIEDGDPLFDLCPVWMAGPSTVAQIFPRRELFDVVVFDEASQCRLEEAMPVLLRGARVVVAGDPKQLPPTRFFESNVAESDDTDAETIEELAEQQMSETEDLLSASLNLDVEEAFLDVHYRSRNEALIGFSNEAFYGRRLQPIPGHPRNKALQAPLKLTSVDGVYQERTNPAEAIAAVDLLAKLLDDDAPPSIGIVSFNINQRDLIIEVLEERAEQDKLFAERLAAAQVRRGRDSFEGLFVRNLESVQGDERDHIIISTTFGPDSEGKFRRNFGALSRVGGDRRLNVLVTRARSAIHVLTSIPRSEYRSAIMPEPGQITGRHQLYAYLRYAEYVEEQFENYQDYLETMKHDAQSVCNVIESDSPSKLAIETGLALRDDCRIGSTVHWGNDGFCVDVALTHPDLPEDVTLGLLIDFNRFRKTPDPIAWEYFRTEILRGQGWNLKRIWSPILAREPAHALQQIADAHTDATTKDMLEKVSEELELEDETE